ncbi:MAG: hypothetical protein PHC28_17810 [Flavobacterium sp.]|uniref:hypothetical protein n=1 Tax=Flavobacterium sp. TaxID=239 RepID=UPI0026305A02|nr:hypothetical protein [Flavobacterium sp.]MDD5152303.1 hypothetical protein [Flavobacterium sp.]
MICKELFIYLKIHKVLCLSDLSTQLKTEEINEIKIEIKTPYISGLGEKLESILEKDYKTFLPTNADWGYAFRLELQKTTFDIVVYENPKIENKIEISPVFTIFQKIIKLEYAVELQDLIIIVKDSLIEIENNVN